MGKRLVGMPATYEQCHGIYINVIANRLSKIVVGAQDFDGAFLMVVELARKQVAFEDVRKRGMTKIVAHCGDAKLPLGVWVKAHGREKDVLWSASRERMEHLPRASIDSQGMREA